jgi:hypothetical protein
MGSTVSGLFGGGGGGDGGASEAAAATQVQYQRDALDYLKQTEKIPQSLREGALTGLGGEYGLTIGKNGKAVMNPGSIVSHAEASPFYQTAVRRGEESVLRNASATGGLRSGNTSENLAEVNQNALFNAYQTQLSGLNGMANLPSNANNIAAATAGIGQTLAQGQIGSSQSIAAGKQNQLGNMMGLAQIGMQAYAMSDRRLKSCIVSKGKSGLHNVYSWTWNKAANAIGLVGDSSGVMADEVELTHPHAVSIRDGFKCVDYSAIGVDRNAI